MKSAVAVVLSILSLANIGAAECHGDNCARAVTGTRPGKEPDVTSRKSDCYSIMITTVTPDTYTSTVTRTIYTDRPPRSKRLALQEPDAVDAIAASATTTTVPTAIPPYASQCNGRAGYSSACSCWGITAFATTISAPTVVSTTTKYLNVGCKKVAKCPVPKADNFRCGAGGKALCSCFLSADNKGQKLCVENRTCGEARPCRSARSCHVGEGCVRNHCCKSRGPGVCLKLAPEACINPAFPRGIFDKGGQTWGALAGGDVLGQSVECTAFNCAGSEAADVQSNE